MGIKMGCLRFHKRYERIRPRQPLLSDNCFQLSSLCKLAGFLRELPFSGGKSMNFSMNNARIAVFLIALAFLIAGISLAPAQAPDASARFPQPTKVSADYPDRAQRAAAYYVLAEALAQA